MANLAATAVTVNHFWIEGERTGARRKVLDITLVLTGQGGTTNKIPASLFGLTYISKASQFTKSDNSAFIPGAASYDRSYLLLNSTPADATGTYRGLITGIE